LVQPGKTYACCFVVVEPVDSVVSIQLLGETFPGTWGGDDFVCLHFCWNFALTRHASFSSLQFSERYTHFPGQLDQKVQTTFEVV
jgi:hypothetical protein